MPKWTHGSLSTPDYGGIYDFLLCTNYTVCFFASPKLPTSVFPRKNTVPSPASSTEPPSRPDRRIPPVRSLRLVGPRNFIVEGRQPRMFCLVCRNIESSPFYIPVLPSYHSSSCLHRKRLKISFHLFLFFYCFLQIPPVASPSSAFPSSLPELATCSFPGCCTCPTSPP